MTTFPTSLHRSLVRALALGAQFEPVNRLTDDYLLTVCSHVTCGGSRRACFAVQFGATHTESDRETTACPILQCAHTMKPLAHQMTPTGVHRMSALLNSKGLPRTQTNSRPSCHVHCSNLPLCSKSFRHETTQTKSCQISRRLATGSTVACFKAVTCNFADISGMASSESADRCLQTMPRHLSSGSLTMFCNWRSALLSWLTSSAVDGASLNLTAFKCVGPDLIQAT